MTLSLSVKFKNFQTSYLVLGIFCPNAVQPNWLLVSIENCPCFDIWNNVSTKDTLIFHEFLVQFKST